jgi:endonuclease/exonuclease/phosphatase family metal-dependent hydrolase
MKIYLLPILLVMSTYALACDKPLLIGTQNLWHYAKNYQERLQNLQSDELTKKFDAIAFQEAWNNLKGQSLYNAFLRHGNYRSNYVRTNNLFAMKEGLAIASRFKLIGKRMVKELSYSRWMSKRILMGGLYQTPFGKMYLFNLHLSPYSKGQSRRVTQIKDVRDFLLTMNRELPVLLMGDFNQDIKDFPEFFKPLEDLGLKVAELDECTYCAENPYTDQFTSRLDYILYSKKHFKINKVQRIFVDNPISDHYGVAASFCFDPNT